MSNLKGCFLHNSDHWATPRSIYNWFIYKCGYFDPCPLHCDSFDGLNIDWPLNVFCNPPYSNIDAWVDKAIFEHKKHYESDIVFLVPARTDTKWFAKLMNHASNVIFITGRLRFNDDKKSAPFPSVMIHLYYGSETTTCYCVKRQEYDKYCSD